jgi:hypothetical protein
LGRSPDVNRLIVPLQRGYNAYRQLQAACDGPPRRRPRDASARLGRLVVGELIEERHQGVLGGDANEQLAV